MPTFEERLALDKERRDRWRDEAKARKIEEQEEEKRRSFRPELNPKTSKILAARAARVTDEATPSDVFARQERERQKHEERRKQAKDLKLDEEKSLFKPMINGPPGDEEGAPKLAKWEGMPPALAWATKRAEEIEKGAKLRDEKRNGTRAYITMDGSSQQSTIDSPRQARTNVHDLPLPTLPSMKHSGKPHLQLTELHRLAGAHRQALLHIQPSMRLESPRKFGHLKGNDRFLGYEIPDASQTKFVKDENELLMKRLLKINAREPVYAEVEPIRPGGGTMPRNSKKFPRQSPRKPEASEAAAEGAA
jgi:hypothetical protein